MNDLHKVNRHPQVIFIILPRFFYCEMQPLNERWPWWWLISREPDRLILAAALTRCYAQNLSINLHATSPSNHSYDLDLLWVFSDMILYDDQLRLVELWSEGCLTPNLLTSLLRKWKLRLQRVKVHFLHQSTSSQMNKTNSGILSHEVF